MTFSELYTKFKTFWQSFTGRVLAFFIGCIVATAVGFKINLYLGQSQIKLKLQELMLIQNEKYVYLFEVENTGNTVIDEASIEVLVHENIYSSVFATRNTTHDPIKTTENTEVEGKLTVNSTDEYSVMSIPLKENGRTNKSKYHAKTFELTNKSQWYDLALGKFLIKKGQTIQASIVISHPISTQDIRCKPIACDVENVSTISTRTYDRIFHAMSLENDKSSNKLFGEGLGISELKTLNSESIIDARNLALADLYKDITQKLYGVTIQSVESSIESFVKTKGPIQSVRNQETRVEVQTSGKIDLSSLVIYFENSAILSTEFRVVYIVKGYYKLPFEIDMEKFHFNTSNIAQLREPITLKGEQPSWVNNFEFDNKQYNYAVGTSNKEANIATAKRFAVSDARLQLSHSISISVETSESSTSTRSLHENNTPDSNVLYESRSKQRSSNKLEGLQVMQYYIDNEGTVFALVRILKAPLKEPPK